jgi:hypothetical protein
VCQQLRTWALHLANSTTALICHLHCTLGLNVQVSSIGLYLAGLIGFAVLLALVEQSVLQVR